MADGHSKEFKQSSLFGFVKKTLSTEPASSSSPTSPLTTTAKDHRNHASTSTTSRILAPTERHAREEYIRRGPVRDTLDTYPKTSLGGKKRSFQPQWLEGRMWLEYSAEIDAALCFACRLFGKTVYDATFQKHGFRQWHRALETNRGFSKHEASKEHCVSMAAWQDFLQQKPVDAQISEERRRMLEVGNQERLDRRNIIPLLLDITNTLARLRVPFRGHDESRDSRCRGVFLEVVDLISRWNNELRTHVIKSQANPNSYPSYISPSSQNEMIHFCSKYFRDITVKKVKEAKYFTVCMDTTPDCGRQDQLSIILRYVDKDGSVAEDLLDTVHAKNMTAKGLFDSLQDLLQKFELDIQDIRGQGYDGCSTMAGCYTGVQARVRELNDHAYYMHCYAHRLNLVLADTCCKIVQVRNFFGIVSSLYDFIEGSTKRHSTFKTVREQVVADMDLEKDGSKTLRSLSSTRWSARIDNCRALNDNLVGVVRTLETISEDLMYDRKTAGEATSLLKSIDFDFCLVLTILTDLLEASHVVSRNLQSPKLNIAAAANQVEALIGLIQSKRTDENFDNKWNLAEAKAASIGVEFVEPRRKKVPRLLDEHWSTEVALSGKEKLKKDLFLGTIDIMLSTLSQRFSSTTLPLLSSTSCLLNPSIEKIPHLHHLHSFYLRDLELSLLVNEYRLFCHAQIPENCFGCIQTMYCFMIDSDMSEMYPTLSLLYKLILTLPVTSCACERVFSALKFVKNSLRTTMSQDRLSDLLIIAVQGQKLSMNDLECIKGMFCEVYRK